MFPPSRIVCLTEETVETLYLLGEQDRIVGISGYVVRPPQARREKPRVSAFTSANIDKILPLKPDLVLTFSDLQADIAADLIRRGVDVHAFNQRHAAIPGAPVSISVEPGSPFQAFNGALTGATLQIIPQRLVIQSWCSTKFKDGIQIRP
jgi:ABC-type Fe3+-hydroxamate transport system substrate-binding protein